MSQSITVAKFEGQDFAVWKAQMEALLVAKGWDHVLKEKCPAEEAAKAAWENSNRQARSLLLLSLDNKHAKVVLKCITAKDIWAKLSTLHEQTSQANKMVLTKRFYELQMERGEKIQEFVARAEYIHGQLQDIGITSIDETALVSKIVTGLPRNYVTFMSAWGNVNSADQKLEILLPRLLAEESLMTKYKNYDETGDALTANSFKGKRRTIRQKSGKCFICHEDGHWKNECPKKKDYEGTAMIAESEANVSISDAEWILDSGASEHMTFDQNSYISYRKLDSNRLVRFGNNEKGEGIGIGDIKVRTEVGFGRKRIIILKDVLHVPGLRRKLFSVSATTQQGNKGSISSNAIVLRDTKGRIC